MTTGELIDFPLPLVTIPITVTREIIITDEQTLLVVEIIVHFPSVIEVGISNANFQGRERLMQHNLPKSLSPIFLSGIIKLTVTLTL